MTEKDYNPEQKNAKAMKQQAKVSEAKAPSSKPKNSESNSSEKAPVEEKIESKGKEDKNKDENKDEKKKPVKGTEKPKEKKSVAMVNSKNVPVSTKYAIAICKFLKGKKIDKAIGDLEQVQKLKKPVPMKGEIPHRKGRIMSGRFPVRASKDFITILKSLRGTALVNEIEEPVITRAIANQAQRPFGRFGRVKRKRTHITLVAESSVKGPNRDNPELRNSGLKGSKK